MNVLLLFFFSFDALKKFVDFEIIVGSQASISHNTKRQHVSFNSFPQQ